MGVAEVEGKEGVGQAVIELIWLWKCVEKGEQRAGTEWWAMSRKTGRRLLGPNLCRERASAGAPPINQFSDVFVFDEISAVGRCEAFFYFLEKPFIVVDHAFDSFDHERLALAALLRG